VFGILGGLEVLLISLTAFLSQVDNPLLVFRLYAFTILIESYETSITAFEYILIGLIRSGFKRPQYLAIYALYCVWYGLGIIHLFAPPYNLNKNQ
jgi:hypothetical protein